MPIKTTGSWGVLLRFLELRWFYSVSPWYSWSKYTLIFRMMPSHITSLRWKDDLEPDFTALSIFERSLLCEAVRWDEFGFLVKMIGITITGPSWCPALHDLLLFLHVFLLGGIYGFMMTSIDTEKYLISWYPRVQKDIGYFLLGLRNSNSIGDFAQPMPSCTKAGQPKLKRVKLGKIRRNHENRGGFDRVYHLVCVDHMRWGSSKPCSW